MASDNTEIAPISDAASKLNLANPVGSLALPTQAGNSSGSGREKELSSSQPQNKEKGNGKKAINARNSNNNTDSASNLRAGRGAGAANTGRGSGSNSPRNGGTDNRRKSESGRGAHVPAGGRGRGGRGGVGSNGSDKQHASGGRGNAIPAKPSAPTMADRLKASLTPEPVATPASTAIVASHNSSSPINNKGASRKQYAKENVPSVGSLAEEGRKTTKADGVANSSSSSSFVDHTDQTKAQISTTVESASSDSSNSNIAGNPSTNVSNGHSQGNRASIPAGNGNRDSSASTLARNTNKTQSPSHSSNTTGSSRSGQLYSNPPPLSAYNPTSPMHPDNIIVPSKEILTSMASGDGSDISEKLSIEQKQQRTLYIQQQHLLIAQRSQLNQANSHQHNGNGSAAVNNVGSPYGQQTTANGSMIGGPWGMNGVVTGPYDPSIAMQHGGHVMVPGGPAGHGMMGGMSQQPHAHGGYHTGRPMSSYNNTHPNQNYGRTQSSNSQGNTNSTTSKSSSNVNSSGTSRDKHGNSQSSYRNKNNNSADPSNSSGIRNNGNYGSHRNGRGNNYNNTVQQAYGHPGPYAGYGMVPSVYDANGMMVPMPPQYAHGGYPPAIPYGGPMPGYDYVVPVPYDGGYYDPNAMMYSDGQEQYEQEQSEVDDAGTDTPVDNDEQNKDNNHECETATIEKEVPFNHDDVSAATTEEDQPQSVSKA